MRIAYFVHDINDPAVRRRIRTLSTGGADISLLGFSRKEAPPTLAADQVILGHTQDGRMGQRMQAVVKAALRVPGWKSALAGADAIIARQLETLLLAVLARRLSGSSAPITYECLDIHRLMLGTGLPGRLLRRLEGALLRHCDTLMVSSQQFVTQYFAPTHGILPRVELVENKVLENEVADLAALPAQRAYARPVGPPWQISWIGIVRCRRSLHLLAELARSLPGLVEIHIHGRVVASEVPDFDEVVASTPGLAFEGPYDRLTDLPRLYSTPHFFWAIDFFDGASSTWLLPNRLYEGGLFAAVPIAKEAAETGRWLAAHHAGALFGDPLAEALRMFFVSLTQEKYLRMHQAMCDIPIDACLSDEAECRSLTQRLVRPKPRSGLGEGAPTLQSASA